MYTRVIKNLAVSITFLIFCGCAIMDKDNRTTLNYLDSKVEDTWITNTTTGKIAAAPLFVPVGLTAGTVDAVVITPVRKVEPAWKDTSSVLWENPSGSDFRQMILLLPKVVATPIVFTTDWFFRSTISFKAF